MIEDIYYFSIKNQFKLVILFLSIAIAAVAAILVALIMLGIYSGFALIWAAVGVCGGGYLLVTSFGIYLFVSWGKFLKKINRIMRYGGKVVSVRIDKFVQPTQSDFVHGTSYYLCTRLDTNEQIKLDTYGRFGEENIYSLYNIKGENIIDCLVTDIGCLMVRPKEPLLKEAVEKKILLKMTIVHLLMGLVSISNF